MTTDTMMIRESGKVFRVRSVEIDGRRVFATGLWLKTAAIPEEELIEGDTVSDPEAFVSRLMRTGLNADLFTFAQRVPHTAPKHPLYIDWEDAAVIPITTFTQWWKERTEYSIRKAVNRARKLGVITKVIDFTDEFAAAISTIYNETPVRQGKAFWHYKKDAQTVKHELATYLDRSMFIGAYYESELIGSMKLTFVGSTATIMQILSSKKHFEKRPNNALIAKAVEMCEANSKSHLVYGNFIYFDPNSTLTEFKRRNGFEPMPLPRYYVPLTGVGKMALKLRIHRGVAGRLPKPVLSYLLKLRGHWYVRKLKAIERTSLATR
jgi:hypothetical protein